MPLTTLNTAAAEKPAAKSTVEKMSEKLAEKRRALGRGLEALLPGPRIVPGSGVGTAPANVQPVPAANAEPTSPQEARMSVAPAVAPPPPEIAAGAGTPLAPLTESDAAMSTREGGNGEATVVELQAMATAQTPQGETVYELPLDRVMDNPNQTRLSFDKAHLEELAASIATQGVMQPITVRPAADGKFFLILGERRVRASRMAGKATIPAIIRRVSEQQAFEMTITENLQRQDLDCMEQAGAFAMLSLRFHLTQDEIGRKVGLSRETVANYLRLLKLPVPVIRSIQSKALSYSHARLLLRLTDDEQIATMAQMAVEKAMSVQQLEDEIERIAMPGGAPKDTEGPKRRGARWVDPNVRAAQRTLEAALGMRVWIRDRKGKGKIIIEYTKLEDFDRVVKMLKGK